MIYVTFYKAQGAFAGGWNSFTAWMTGGQYCHSEIVLNIPPDVLMNLVGEVYSKNTHNLNLIQSIETTFFDSKRAKEILHNSETVWLSFSSLWGEPMATRFLEEMKSDSWFAIPGENTPNIDVVQIPTTTDEQLKDVARFCIAELGKQYDKTGALTSWLPSFGGQTDVKTQTSIFCSELCVGCLQIMGLLQHVDAKSVTPNALYELLKSI